MCSGIAIEEMECSIKQEQGNGLTSVSLNGNINGMEFRDANLNLVTSKYSNALTHYNSIEPSLLTRAQNYASGVTLNPFFLNKVIGKNEINGNVSYQLEYDNRPTNIFSGVRLENIQISENFAGDLFSVIPVIGRANGPVLQSLNSYTERTVSLSIELALAPQSFGSGTIPELRTAFYNNPRLTQSAAFSNIIQAARPSLNYNTIFEFTNQPNESWNPKDGRYNYSISWTFGN